MSCWLSVGCPTAGTWLGGPMREVGVVGGATGWLCRTPPATFSPREVAGGRKLNLEPGLCLGSLAVVTWHWAKNILGGCLWGWGSRGHQLGDGDSLQLLPCPCFCLHRGCWHGPSGARLHWLRGFPPGVVGPVRCPCLGSPCLGLQPVCHPSVAGAEPVLHSGALQRGVMAAGV